MLNGHTSKDICRLPKRQAAENERRAARDALSQQKKQAKDTQKASSAALREQKR